MISIATTLPWSDPHTRAGKVFRRATATPDVLAAWRTDSAPFKANGIELGAFHCDGTYELFKFEVGGSTERGTCLPERTLTSATSPCERADVVAQGLLSPINADVAGKSSPPASSLSDAPGSSATSPIAPKSVIVASNEPRALPRTAGVSVPLNEKAIECIQKRKPIVTVIGSQLIALCQRKDVRVLGMKIGKTNAEWVCSVGYPEAKLV